jgi:hypothetical protein
MSRQSLRAALVRLTSFETTPPYDAVVDVGRELNDVRMDDFAGSYPLSPARGLLYAAARLTHPRLTEADRARWNDGGHIIGLLRQWDGNELWPYDRNQLIAFARDADAELERRTPLANIAAEGGVVGGQDHAVVPAVVLDLNAVHCATPAALALRSSGAKPSGQATDPAAVPQLITDPPKTPVEIFFSYSHKDATLLDKLVAHLSQLKHQGLIAGWHDRKIAAGTEWEREIDEHLNSARIILLLISADFLASGYCYGVEMKRALQRHEAGEARVIPIILRPCDWHTSLFGKLQALPEKAKPVTKWSNQDSAFTDVVRGIRAAVMELTA